MLYIWTDNDLKYIDSGEPHQILILLRVLDHIMHLRQNTDWGTKLQLTIESATQMANTSKDNPLEYKPKYVIHQAHLMI